MIRPPSVATTLWEGDTLPELEWHDRLGITDTQFRSLASDRVLRLSTGGQIPKYRLDLVGLLFTRDHAFTVLPKIFRNAANLSVARDSIACVRIYLSRLKRRLRHAEASEILSAHNSGAKSVDILLALIDWTLDRGFHAEDFEARSDESFDIDWIATMDQGIPLHVGRSVIYSEIIGRRASYQLGPLARLQAQALLTLHQQLQPSSLLWLAEHDSILEQAAQITSEIAAVDDASISDLDALADFLGICNRDHDRELASILFDWLSDGRRSPDQPTAFGTTAFQFVWEDMCEVATTGLGDPLSHKDIASQPGYLVGESHVETAGQRPDIIRRLDDGICILDAKWYDISRQEWPGAPDVVKQVMYQASVVESQQVLCNAFLVPVDEGDAEPRVIGMAHMAVGGEADVRFPPVDVMAIPWKTAVAAYCGLAKGNRIADAIRGAAGDAKTLTCVV